MCKITKSSVAFVATLDILDMVHLISRGETKQIYQ